MNFISVSDTISRLIDIGFPYITTELVCTFDNALSLYLTSVNLITNDIPLVDFSCTEICP